MDHCPDKSLNSPADSPASAAPYRSFPLTRIVSWSQQLVAEVLAPGDLAVDLTAGRGRDTLALARAVGPQGQVVAFDLQRAALDQTASLLQEQGFAARCWPAGQRLPRQTGIFLVQACHSSLSSITGDAPRAIMANLGYLPGGDPALVTRPLSTVAALRGALDLLAAGGRLAVTVYPGHPGGLEEGRLVEELLGSLPGDRWQVLSLRVANVEVAPYLLVAERLDCP